MTLSAIQLPLGAAQTSNYGMLYISRLATGLGPQAVSAVFREARHRMPALNLSGVLLFDGERFAQWVQGPQSDLQTEITLVNDDKRQQDLRVLFEGSTDSTWLTLPTASGRTAWLPSWLAGWAPPDELLVLESMAFGSDADVTHALHALLPTCDLL